MAYTVKTRDEFQSYLKTVTVLPTYDEVCIDKFNSSSLFELYELLLTIVDDNQISPKMQEKLKNTLKENFPEEICSLLSFPIEKETTIDRLENVIKDKFLEYYESSKTTPLSSQEQKEFDQLKIIVAKKFPKVFMELVKESTDPKEITREIEFIRHKFEDTIDNYIMHNEKSQNDEDILTAIYTFLKSNLPDIHTHEPARQKALGSVKDNAIKEISKSLNSLIPSHIEQGITFNDLSEKFNLDKITDDFVGFTTVIDYIPSVTEFDTIVGIDEAETFNIDQILEVFNTSEQKSDSHKSKVQQLFELAENLENMQDENVLFYRSLSKFLRNPFNFIDFNKEQYLQIKIELLSHLQDTTFQKCSEEYEYTNSGKTVYTCFSKLLQSAIDEYNSLLETDKTPSDLSETEHTALQEELLILNSELKNRVYDKYQALFALVSINKLFNDKNFTRENILRDYLKTSSLSTKTSLKRNGFVSFYVIVQMPDGRKIEVQLQPSMRFKDSKTGRSDHSLMTNKQLDISQFFELNDSFNRNNPNYQKILSSIIKILDNTTVAERNRLFSTPMELLSNSEKKLRRDLEFAQKSIQIKENGYQNEYTVPSEDGTSQISIKGDPYSIEQYLPIFASYHSPKLFAASSPHSRVNENIAFISIKSYIDNFRERLLKTDSITCLANMLLNRLKKIDPETLNKYFSTSPGQYFLPQKPSYSNSVSEIKERLENERN